MRTYSGIVMEGERRGTHLGFPTANILLPEGELDGVFAARANVRGKTYSAAVFADPSRGVLEAYLIDFYGTLYGEELRIELHQKIRDRQRFTDDAALKAAIGKDVESVRVHFIK